MPVPTEVDDLDRAIVRLEEDIRKRKIKVELLRNDIAEAGDYVKKCAVSRELCMQNIVKMKKHDLVDLTEYREMYKLYEDNCDLYIQYQTVYSNRNKDLIEVQEKIPVLEAFLKEAKRRRQEWGVVVEFHR